MKLFLQERKFLKSWETLARSNPQVPTITKVKPQKNKKRVNIYLDGKFGFGLDLESFMKFGLKVEQELTEEKVKEIVKESEFKKTYDKLVKYATLRPRSKKEIKDWLRRKKVHESIHKELFNRLKSLDLIDDEAFSKWWIEQRTNFKPKGKLALSAELRKKGVDRKIVERALSEVEIDEEALAKETLEKKKYKWEKLPKFEKKKKMNDFLARRGFSWDAIKKALKDLDN